MHYLKRNKQTPLPPELHLIWIYSTEYYKVNSSVITGKDTQMLLFNFIFDFRNPFSFCYVFSHLGFWWGGNISLCKYIITVRQPTRGTRGDACQKLPNAQHKCHCSIYAFIFGLSGKLSIQIHKTWEPNKKKLWMLPCKDFAKGTGFAIKNDTLKHKITSFCFTNTKYTKKIRNYFTWKHLQTNLQV